MAMQKDVYGYVLKVLQLPINLLPFTSSRFKRQDPTQFALTD